MESDRGSIQTVLDDFRTRHPEEGLADVKPEDWLAQGFNAEQVNQWLQAGVFRPEKAASLRTHDITVEQAALTRKGADMSLGGLYTRGTISLDELKAEIRREQEL